MMSTPAPVPITITRVTDDFYAVIYDNKHAIKISPHEQSALIEAIKEDNIEAVKFLLRNTFDVDRPGLGGCTPLMIAISKHRPKIVRLLLKEDADPNIVHPHFGSALHICAKAHSNSGLSCYHAQCMRYLIAHGADVNIPFKKSVLRLAIKSGVLERVKVLIEAGVDVTPRDINLALHIECDDIEDFFTREIQYKYRNLWEENKDKNIRDYSESESE